MSLDLIASSQAQKEVTANALFVAAAPAMLFALKASTTSGLTFGYYGGNLIIAGTPTLIADGTLTLTNSATNYIEVTAAGVVSSNTTAFTGGRTALYTGVAVAGVVTYVDKRTSGVGGTATLTGSAGGDLAGTYPSPTWTGGTASKSINGAPTVTIASAATVNIGAALANYLSITGTVTITAFDTIAAGAERALAFAGALLLTHNGTSLILPSAANITTAAGDVAFFVSLGSGNWRCTSYQRATGAALVASSGSPTGSAGGDLTGTYPNPTLALATVHAWTKNQSVTFTALTDGATISTDASLSNNFRVTIAGNRTLANPTNLTDGMVLNFYIKQDATGSRTLAYGSAFKFPGGAPTLTTTASAKDLITCVYDGTDAVLLCNLVKAFA